ncbi:MAG: hypothetical protein ABIJ40_03320 [Bacteroidota bacterium]
MKKLKIKFNEIFVPYQSKVNIQYWDDLWKWISNNFEPKNNIKTQKMLQHAENNGKKMAINEIIKQLENYLKNGSIDFMCVNLKGIKRRLIKALK